MSGLGAVGWGTGAAAFIAGVVSFFSPCVAPLVPGYMSYLAATSVRRVDAAGGAGAGGAGVGRAVGDVAVLARPSVRVCLLFVAGFSVTFIALGLAVASFGTLLSAYKLVLETVAGIAMVLMGAFLLNLLPRAWMEALSREWRLRAPAGAGALGGLAPFALGVVFAAGWTPCIGPVLGSILLYVGASANLGKGFVLLTIYALGFALPFIGVGLGWSSGLRALGWLKRHGNVVTMASGVALILVGLVYLSGQAAQFSAWAQRLTPVGLG
jgi:cytochrome c-type biogenesis protein